MQHGKSSITAAVSAERAADATAARKEKEKAAADITAGVKKPKNRKEKEKSLNRFAFGGAV